MDTSNASSTTYNPDDIVWFTLHPVDGYLVAKINVRKLEEQRIRKRIRSLLNMP